MILLIQITIVVAFVFAITYYVNQQTKPTNVYVFSKDIAINTKIADSDIAVKSIPANAVTADMEKDKTKIVGEYVNSKVFSNEFVLDKQLVKKEDIDPFATMDLSKYRKISVPINYIDGLAGNLKAGDHVDVAFVGKGQKNGAMGSSQTPFEYSKIFLQDVLVFNVATEDGYKFVDHSSETQQQAVNAGTSNGNKQQISTTSSNEKMGVVTLAVTTDQAEQLLARMNAGTLQIIGRFDDSQNYQTLGFVLGDFQKTFAGNGLPETNAGN